MRTHVRFFLVLVLPTSLLSCSSPQSQERLNTVLCWLRPSCLPSDLPSSTAEAPRAKPPSTQINSVAPSKRPQPISPQSPLPKILDPQNCVTSTQITVTGSNPLVTVSYIEPTTKANGQALTNLAKTTIYQDLGKGLVKYKDVQATNPAGGGTIQEKISFSLKPEETVYATICVTATDTNGREG